MLPDRSALRYAAQLRGSFGQRAPVQETNFKHCKLGAVADLANTTVLLSLAEFSAISNQELGIDKKGTIRVAQYYLDYVGVANSEFSSRELGH
jgi:hypothetical protein